MKKLLFVILAFISYAGFAQQSAQLKDNYIVQSSDKVLFTINLTNDITSAQLAELNQWSADNAQFFTTSVKGRTVTLNIRKEKFERNLLSKALGFLQVDQIVTPSGKQLSLESFFNENNL